MVFVNLHNQRLLGGELHHTLMPTRPEEAAVTRELHVPCPGSKISRSIGGMQTRAGLHSLAVRCAVTVHWFAGRD